MHEISCGYKLDWYDCMISACETNEMVGVKVAWYWHEMKFHNYGLRAMKGYGTTGKEMKEVNYKELVCDVYVYVW